MHDHTSIYIYIYIHIYICIHIYMYTAIIPGFGSTRADDGSYVFMDAPAHLTARLTKPRPPPDLDRETQLKSCLEGHAQFKSKGEFQKP